MARRKALGGTATREHVRAVTSSVSSESDALARALRDNLPELVYYTACVSFNNGRLLQVRRLPDLLDVQRAELSNSSDGTKFLQLVDQIPAQDAILFAACRPSALGTQEELKSTRFVVVHARQGFAQCSCLRYSRSGSWCRHLWAVWNQGGATFSLRLLHRSCIYRDVDPSVLQQSFRSRRPSDASLVAGVPLVVAPGVDFESHTALYRATDHSWKQTFWRRNVIVTGATEDDEMDVEDAVGEQRGATPGRGAQLPAEQHALRPNRSNWRERQPNDAAAAPVVRRATAATNDAVAAPAVRRATTTHAAADDDDDDDNTSESTVADSAPPTRSVPQPGVSVRVVTSPAPPTAPTPASAPPTAPTPVSTSSPSDDGTLHLPPTVDEVKSGMLNVLELVGPDPELRRVALAMVAQLRQQAQSVFEAKRTRVERVDEVHEGADGPLNKRSSPPKAVSATRKHGAADFMRRGTKKNT